MTSSASTPFDAQLGDLHGLQHLPDERHLGREQVGGLLAARLVLGVEVVAERPDRGVEGHRQVLRLLVGQQLHQHGGEPEDGVRHRAGLGGQVGRKGVEGPVGQGVAVEEDERRHSRHRRAGVPQGRQVLLPSRSCRTASASSACLAMSISEWISARSRPSVADHERRPLVEQRPGPLDPELPGHGAVGVGQEREFESVLLRELPLAVDRIGADPEADAPRRRRTPLRGRGSGSSPWCSPAVIAFGVEKQDHRPPDQLLRQSHGARHPGPAVRSREQDRRVAYIREATDRSQKPKASPGSGGGRPGRGRLSVESGAPSRFILGRPKKTCQEDL